MKKDLKLLSSKLKEYGEYEASLSVNELIKSISEIRDISLLKTAETSVASGDVGSVTQDSTNPGLTGFIEATSQEPTVTAPTNPGLAGFIEATSQEPQPQQASQSFEDNPEFKAWYKILEDYEKVPGRVEKFHEISDKIMSTVLSPILGHKKDLVAEGAQEPSEAQKNHMASKMREQGRSVNTAMEMSEEMQGGEEGPLFMTASNFYIKQKKIASTNNYLDNYLSSIDLMNHDFKLISLAASEVNPMGMLEMMDKEERGLLGAVDPRTGQTSWGELAGANKIKPAGVKPGLLGRGMAVIGILFSGPLLVKNLVEAIRNGNTIVNELPLEKYEISITSALTGLSANKLIGKIRKAIRENQENPEALYEILEIAKTLSAYWLDVIFMVTNALMAIIDILTLVAMFATAPLPIVSAAAGGIGMLLSMGLMGLEFGAESMVHSYWDAQKLKIKKIAEKNIISMTGGEEKSGLIAGAEAPTITSDTFQVAASLTG